MKKTKHTQETTPVGPFCALDFVNLTRYVYIAGWNYKARFLCLTNKQLDFCMNLPEIDTRRVGITQKDGPVIPQARPPFFGPQKFMNNYQVYKFNWFERFELCYKAYNSFINLSRRRIVTKFPSI